ncbi:MAG: LPS export ABC transporter periplasmic protein LptC [Cyanobacteria bacterium J06598_4]
MLLLLMVTTGCQPGNEQADSVSDVSRVDTQLLLNNAVLEQSNRDENTVWKIKADNITYSEDNRVATLTKVVGNLWQNDSVILKIRAEAGEVKDNGNIIVLNGNVIASDPRNGSTINSEVVEWRPQENLLLIPQQLTGTNANLQVVADSGQYRTDFEKLELEKNVVATSEKPALQLTSDRLEWDLKQQQVISPGAVKLVHYNQNQTITDKLISDRAELNLATNQATLNKNIELISLDPPLQVATDSLTWNYLTRIGKSDRPIQILDRQRQISLTGNRGDVNLSQRLATLQDGVKGINQLESAEIFARQMTWKMDTKEVEAKGNVIYEQIDPQARLTGEKAIGALGSSNIVVTSDGKQQVTTVIEN